MRTTEQELTQYLREMLGHPYWELEGMTPQKDGYSPNMLKNCINDAILLYGRWKPLEINQSFTMHPGVKEITGNVISAPRIPDGVNGVLDVQFVTNMAQGNPDIEAQMLSGKFAFYGVRSPLYDLTFFVLQQMWIRFAGQHLSSFPDWAWRDNWETGEPALWVYSPGAFMNVDVTFSAMHKTLSTIPNYDEIRIRSLALAKAKMVLGGIRSKYYDIPAANTRIKTDGEIMRNEGVKMWEEEEAKLRSSVSSDIPLAWI